jgi:hypothetical protein
LSALLICYLNADQDASQIVNFFLHLSKWSIAVRLMGR